MDNNHTEIMFKNIFGIYCDLKLQTVKSIGNG